MKLITPFILFLPFYHPYFITLSAITIIFAVKAKIIYFPFNFLNHSTSVNSYSLLLTHLLKPHTPPLFLFFSLSTYPPTLTPHLLQLFYSYPISIFLASTDNNLKFYFPQNPPKLYLPHQSFYHLKKKK
jgi:hypothetical protein